MCVKYNFKCSKCSYKEVLTDKDHEIKWTENNTFYFKCYRCSKPYSFTVNSSKELSIKEVLNG